MAKRKSPQTQIVPERQELPDYGELVSIMTGEVATILSDYIRQWVGAVPESGIFLNRDRVLTTQSYMEMAWYDLYAEVERDPHVKAILDSAKMNVANTQWMIQSFLIGKERKPSKRNEAIAEFVRAALDNSGHNDTTAGIVNGFPQHLYNWMGAIGMGFSVNEAIYTDPDTWDTEGVRIKSFLNRDPRRFQFSAADRSLRLRTMKEAYYGEPLPERKFIVHRCSATWENPFGDALDQSLYWMWLFKRTVSKFWMQHLQVAAASVPIVKYPAGSNQTFKAEAKEIAKQIRNGAYGAIPENFAIEYAEAAKGADNAQSYNNFMRWCDDQMSKCVNGQTLTTEASSTTGTGTYAQGKVHEDTQAGRDLYRARGLEATLNATVVKWLVDFNFANVDGYPSFKFDLEETEDLVRESQVVKNLTDAGYDFDPQELSEKFSYTITKKQPLKLALAKPEEKPIEEPKPVEEENAEGSVATA